MAIINGTVENDYLTGTSGNDVIVGGKGNDILIGNNGADEFVFENVTSQGFSENGLWYIIESNDGTDMIYNFKEGEDKIISNSPPNDGTSVSEVPMFSPIEINIYLPVDTLIKSGNANPFLSFNTLDINSTNSNNSNSLFDSITPMTLQ